MLELHIIITGLAFLTAGAVCIVGALHVATIGAERADAITRIDD